MKKTMALLAGLLLGINSFSIKAEVIGNWVYDYSGWSFYDQNNLKLTGWIQDSYQCWYLLDYESGIMKTGWVASGSDWYYLNPENGIMQASQWNYDNDGTKYLLPNGIMATGVVVIDGTAYEFADNGRCLGETTLPVDPDSELDDEQPNVPIPDTDIEYDQSEKRAIKKVLRLVNEAREEEGLEPLETDEVLEEAALIRVQELTVYFDHSRPDGSDFSTVLNEAGIDTYYYAENLAFEYRTAEEAVDFWLNSPSHRANLLNPAFTQIAVSIVPSQTGYLWEMILIGE